MLGEELVDVSLDDAGLAAAELPHHQHLEDVLRPVDELAAHGEVRCCDDTGDLDLALTLPSCSTQQVPSVPRPQTDICEQHYTLQTHSVQGGGSYFYTPMHSWKILDNATNPQSTIDAFI